MHERHGGETDAQRQDMLATATAHEGTTILYTPILILSASASTSAVRVLLFHIPESRGGWSRY